MNYPLLSYNTEKQILTIHTLESKMEFSVEQTGKSCLSLGNSNPILLSRK